MRESMIEEVLLLKREFPRFTRKERGENYILVRDYTHYLILILTQHLHNTHRTNVLYRKKDRYGPMSVMLGLNPIIDLYQLELSPFTGRIIVTTVSRMMSQLHFTCEIWLDLQYMLTAHLLSLWMPEYPSTVISRWKYSIERY